MFKGRDAAALPALEIALAKETDPRIKRALLEAQAAVLLIKPDASDLARVAAVETLAQRGDQDALAMLRGQSVEGGAAVKTAAASAATAIERRLALLVNVQNAWYGLSLGSVLLLAAIGLAITFGVMGVINMAHGEMVMLGAYTDLRGAGGDPRPARRPCSTGRCPSPSRWPFWSPALVGVIIERGIIRFLYGRPLETLLADLRRQPRSCSRRCAPSSARPTARSARRPTWRARSRSAACPIT